MPRTSQSAGFAIGAFIVTASYTHNVKKFAAPTAPGNYLHSTEHTKWLIWYNETTARVVCVNVPYFPNSPHIKKCILTSFIALVKETPRKMQIQQLVSPSRQCSSTPVGFGQRVFSKERCDNMKHQLSWPGFNWFLLAPSTEISTAGKALLWWYWHTDIRMRRWSWKGFHKMPSRNIANTFIVAGRSV